MIRFELRPGFAKPVYLCARGSKFGRSPRSASHQGARSASHRVMLCRLNKTRVWITKPGAYAAWRCAREAEGLWFTLTRALRAQRRSVRKLTMRAWPVARSIFEANERTTSWISVSTWLGEGSGYRAWHGIVMDAWKAVILLFWPWKSVRVFAVSESMVQKLFVDLYAFLENRTILVRSNLESFTRMLNC